MNKHNEGEILSYGFTPVGGRVSKETAISVIANQEGVKGGEQLYFTMQTLPFQNSLLFIRTGDKSQPLSK